MRVYILPSGPWYRPPRPHRRNIAPWRVLIEGGSLRAVDPRLGAYHVRVHRLTGGAWFALYRGREAVVVAGCGWSGCAGLWIVAPMLDALAGAGVRVGPLALPRVPWLVLAPGEGFAYAPEVDAAGWMFPWMVTFAWALRDRA